VLASEPVLSAEFGWQEARNNGTLTKEDLIPKIVANGFTEQRADAIAAAYFAEENPELQLNLLRELLFFQEIDAGTFDRFVEMYMREKDKRPFIISAYQWNARTLQ
jgi:hypothetical protein